MGFVVRLWQVRREFVLVRGGKLCGEKKNSFDKHAIKKRHQTSKQLADMV